MMRNALSSECLPGWTSKTVLQRNLGHKFQFSPAPSAYIAILLVLHQSRISQELRFGQLRFLQATRIPTMSVFTHGYRPWTEEEVKLLVRMRQDYSHIPWYNFEALFNELVPSDRKRSAVALASKHNHYHRDKYISRRKKKTILRSETIASASPDQSSGNDRADGSRGTTANL